LDLPWLMVLAGLSVLSELGLLSLAAMITST
jgi:hypothetical protein